MIEIIDCKILNKGSLHAVIGIKMPKMMNFTINNITVWQKDGKKWISMPSREYESEGKKKYFAYCRFEDKQINDNFQATVLKAYEEHALKNPPQNLAIDEDLPF